jgi:hypothetical protein
VPDSNDFDRSPGSEGIRFLRPVSKNLYVRAPRLILMNNHRTFTTTWEHLSGCDGTCSPTPSRSRRRWHQRPRRYSYDCAYATGRQALSCDKRRTSEIAGLSELGTQVSTNCTLCTGSVPPRTQDKLNNERLPQTQQVSCGLSLITSQSAQSTAFCKQTALI